MARIVGGLFSLTMNGKILKPKGEFTWRPSGPKRNEVPNEDGSGDFSEEFMMGYLDGAVTLDGTVPSRDIRDATGATIVARWRNGTTLVLHGASQTGEAAITSRESEMAVRFASDRAEEL